MLWRWSEFIRAPPLRKITLLRRSSWEVRTNNTPPLSSRPPPSSFPVPAPLAQGTRRWYGNESSSSSHHSRNLFSRLLTRRRRPWTRDDLWALLSWLFVGQGLFILVGTTTFASLVLLLANSLQFHDWLARRLTRYLAKHTGLEVSFGDLIVPNWRTGTISFRNISVKSIVAPVNAGDDRDQNSNLLTDATILLSDHGRDRRHLPEHTVYDLTIAKAEVTLNMRRMLEGKGLVQRATIEGVRGSVDRRGVRPMAYDEWRHHPQRGDFDLEGFSLRDVLLTVHSSGDFRPYRFSIISAELARLRKRYILYDLLAAESIVGMMDESLFSMHIPQTHNLQRLPSMRHFKLHSLSVDFLSHSHDNDGGPLSWLSKGRVDIDVFIKLPADHPSLIGGSSLFGKIGSVTEGLLVEILRDSGATALIEQLKRTEAPGGNPTLASLLSLNISLADGVKDLLKKWPFLSRLRSRMQEDFLNVDTRAMEAPEEAARHFMDARPDVMAFKVDFRFHNVRAHAPWSSTLRPLVAYINEQRPFIPLSCHFDLPRERLDGAWTMYEAGIADALYEGTRRSFEMLVEDRQRKIRRLKKVSLWSLYALLRNLRIWFTESGYMMYPRISLD